MHSPIFPLIGPGRGSGSPSVNNLLMMSSGSIHTSIHMYSRHEIAFWYPASTAAEHLRGSQTVKDTTRYGHHK